MCGISNTVHMNMYIHIYICVCVCGKMLIYISIYGPKEI